MDNLTHRLSGKLEERKRDNLLRTLTVPVERIDFASNDYLGLARSQELSQLIAKRLDALGIHANGSTGSRLLTGNSAFTQETEKKLAGIFNSEAALILNSGYSANLAVLSSVPQKGDTIFYDELVHASIKDGIRLSFANRYSFGHNDVAGLESKLSRTSGHKFIVVESLYSMDGDACPLEELAALAEQYEASVILDEAHSTGVMGKGGAGMAVAMGLQDKIAIRIYTFGKAMGIHGACVAGSQVLIDYLINFSRPFIYTTSLPPHSIAAIECAFSHLQNNIHLQNDLATVVNRYLATVGTLSNINRTDSRSAIQTILIPGNREVALTAKTLQEAGLDVRPILSPTVKQGTERLRICLHAFNSEGEINRLATGLSAIIK